MRFNRVVHLGSKFRFLILGCGLTLAVVGLTSQEKTLTVDLGSGVKMEFVLIPAGSFMMGSNTGDWDEKPVHQVTINKPFYVGKYEVTQEQWQTLMGSNPSRFKGLKNPVEMVSWIDCQEFISKLKSKASGLKPRLPTEAEWEYACRAGSTSKFCFGDREANLWQYAWYGEGETGSTHPVGEKDANAWGLFDMHGNVMEWCSNVYDYERYGSSPEIDPQGRDYGYESGYDRVMRGGAWDFGALGCTSSIRFAHKPATRNNDVGFRVVLEIK